MYYVQFLDIVLKEPSVEVETFNSFNQLMAFVDKCERTGFEILYVERYVKDDDGSYYLAEWDRKRGCLSVSLEENRKAVTHSVVSYSRFKDTLRELERQ